MSEFSSLRINIPVLHRYPTAPLEYTFLVKHRKRITCGRSLLSLGKHRHSILRIGQNLEEGGFLEIHSI